MGDINSIMAGWVDRGPWIYYDLVQVNANTASPSSLNPFSVPIGGQDPIVSTQKTKLQTNMQRGNQFPPPRCLVMMMLGFYFSDQMLKSDIDLVLNSCYIEFRIDDKIFWEGLLWKFPAGFGLTGFTTQNGQSAFTNGIPAPQFSRRYGEYSKYIAPLQQFSLSIIFPGTPPTFSANGVGWQMYCLLDGLTDRAVQ
jgi:hypothetical protein